MHIPVANVTKYKRYTTHSQTHARCRNLIVQVTNIDYYANYDSGTKMTYVKPDMQVAA